MQYKKNGFTLIELLVAATILAVLATIAVVTFSNANTRARDGKRRSDMEVIRQALELYRSSNAAYPDTVSFATMLTAVKNAGYLSEPLPSDPKNEPTRYTYTAGSLGATYCICADLENLHGNSTSGTSCGSIQSDPASRYYCLTPP